MRIVYLHQYFNTPEMSGGTRSYEMARRLASFGHEVHMVTTWRKESAEKDWFRTKEAGIEVHWCPVPYANALGFRERVAAFMHYAVKAAGYATALPCDVVFATSTPLTVALPAVYASRKAGVPMVFEVRDLWPEMPVAVGAIKNPLLVRMAEMLERFAYRHAARIVALSPGMADGIGRTGYPSGLISVIPNGCDRELFTGVHADASAFRRKHPELGDRPVILYPGTLGKINGVEYFVRLAVETEKSRPDLRFVVIGDGAERERIRQAASDAGVLHENFFMYQAIPKRELAGAFAAASMIVSLFLDLPEMRVNSANKFFDGLASATAVGLNYEGWQADLLRRADAGLVLSPCARNAADSLVRFFEDESRVREAGRRAGILGRERFDRDMLAGRLDSVLRDALQGERFGNQL